MQIRPDLIGANRTFFFSMEKISTSQVSTTQTINGPWPETAQGRLVLSC